MSLLSKIQTELSAPKNQYNSFGKYKYRSLEDIFEGLKPLLKKYECSVSVSDEIVSIPCDEEVLYADKSGKVLGTQKIGNRVYIKATAKLIDSDGKIVSENTGWAREESSKKGMDVSQVTGATSSYARKYALNGLFAIDDVKDADSMDNSVKKTTPKPPKKDDDW